MPTTPDFFLLRPSIASQVLWQRQGGTWGADHPFADLESSTLSFTGVQRAKNKWFMAAFSRTHPYSARVILPKIHYNCHLFEPVSVFIDVVPTQWPRCRHYKHSPQPMCIVFCLSASFVGFSFQICRCHCVCQAAMRQEHCLCPFSHIPEKKMKRRHWQGNNNCPKLQLKPRGISQLSDKTQLCSSSD